jgi:hypothetical protein
MLRSLALWSSLLLAAGCHRSAVATTTAGSAEHREAAATRSAGSVASGPTGAPDEHQEAPAPRAGRPGASELADERPGDPSGEPAAPDVGPLLRKGRRAASRGDRARALAAFRRSLELSPDHPVALCEAGWAEFQLGRLAAATEHLERGSQLTRAPRLRAACLYSLGRTYERLGKKGEAQGAYRRSLVLRPDSPATERRYRALDPHAAESLSCPPSGPHDSVSAICARLRELDEDDRIYCDASPVEAANGEGSGAWMILYDRFDHSGGWTDYYLLRKQGNRFRLLGQVGSSWSRACSLGTHSVSDVEQRQVIPGGPAELVLTFSVWEFYACHQHVEPDADPYELEEERTMVCAETSGRWRCTGVIEGTVPQGAAVRDMLRCPSF